jgi:hypothetical protein
MNRRTVSAIAIAGITVLESVALITRVDGALLALAIAAVAGLGGYNLGRQQNGGKTGCEE